MVSEEEFEALKESVEALSARLDMVVEMNSKMLAAQGLLISVLRDDTDTVESRGTGGE